MTEHADGGGGAPRATSIRRLPGPVRSLVGLVVGFLLATAAIGAVGAAGERWRDRAPVSLGQLDLAQYCQVDRGEQMMATLLVDDADGWRCVGRRRGVWLTEEIDLDEACQVLHGSDTRALNERPGSPHHWTCVRDL